MNYWVVYDIDMSMNSIYPVYCLWSCAPKLINGIWEPTENIFNKYYFNELTIDLYTFINSKINLNEMVGTIKPIKIYF